MTNTFSACEVNKWWEANQRTDTYTCIILYLISMNVKVLSKQNRLESSKIEILETNCALLLRTIFLRIM
jgi:hypothetical protein